MEKHGESQTRHALLSGAARSPPGPPSPTPQDTRNDIAVTQIVQGTPPVSESATVRLHSTSTLIFLCPVDDHVYRFSLRGEGAHSASRFMPIAYWLCLLVCLHLCRDALRPER